jgi:hypothetical protein
MRSLSPIECTPSAGSKVARLAGLALLVAALAAPPAVAQSGGVSAPGSGGAPAPDPAPTPAPPEPDAAPGAGADSVDTPPSAGTPPAPATSAEPTSILPEASTAAPAAASQAPPAGQRPPRRSGERAAQDKARDKRKARQGHRRSTAERADPASVFGVSVPFVGTAGTDTGSESPPVELIAWALLTLVLAAAALLTLAARVSRMQRL